MTRPERSAAARVGDCVRNETSELFSDVLHPPSPQGVAALEL